MGGIPFRRNPVWEENSERNPVREEYRERISVWEKSCLGGIPWKKFFWEENHDYPRVLSYNTLVMGKKDIHNIKIYSNRYNWDRINKNDNIYKKRSSRNQMVQRTLTYIERLHMKYYRIS